MDCMSIASPDWSPPPRWDLLDRIVTPRRLLVVLVLVLALLLGLTLAVVATLTVDCRDRPNYVLTEAGNPILIEDGSGLLVTEEKSRECRLMLGSALTVRF